MKCSFIEMILLFCVNFGNIFEIYFLVTLLSKFFYLLYYSQLSFTWSENEIFSFCNVFLRTNSKQMSLIQYLLTFMYLPLNLKIAYSPFSAYFEKALCLCLINPFKISMHIYLIKTMKRYFDKLAWSNQYHERIFWYFNFISFS